MGTFVFVVVCFVFVFCWGAFGCCEAVNHVERVPDHHSDGVLGLGGAGGWVEGVRPLLGFTT